MPYQVNRDTYGWPENLAFLAPKQLNLDDKVLAKMYHNEIEHHQRYSSWDRILDSLGVRLFDIWTFFIGPLLSFPVLLIPWFYRNRRSRPLLIFLALIAGLNLTQMVLYPYHLSPVVPVLFALIAAGTRYAYVTLSRSTVSRGIRFALLLPLSVILVQAMKNPAAHLNLPLAYWERAAEGHREDRAQIEAWLAAHPRKQLVIVRYSEAHSPDEEWVYNHADIDGSKVVWARERDAASSEQLLRHSPTGRRGCSRPTSCRAASFPTRSRPPLIGVRPAIRSPRRGPPASTPSTRCPIIPVRKSFARNGST